MNDSLRDSKYRRNLEDYEKHSEIKDSFENDIELFTRENSDAYYILKEIPLKNEYDRARFKNEVKTLICMRIDGFPSIKIDGFGFTNNKNAFIFAEYAPGETLQSLLFKEKYGCFDENEEEDEDNPIFSNTKKMIIIYGVAFGLSYLHSKGYVHRDIKPENIFLDDDKKPYIGDYGDSRQIVDTNRMTGAIGTVPYMAPEMLKDDIILNPNNSVDVYSFAITVLQIITHDLLFGGQSIFDFDDQDHTEADCQVYIKNKILNNERYDLPDDDTFPNEFREFINCCWSSKPEDRWSMNHIVELIREHKLILPNCNINELNQYIQELDDSLKQ